MQSTYDLEIARAEIGSAIAARIVPLRRTAKARGRRAA
jgi:hypothetical protein